MKTKKHLLTLLGATLLSVLVLSMTTVASLTPTPYWSYLIAMSGNMSVSGSGVATIEAECRADALTVDKVKVTCELQRLDGSWETIKTWTETSDGNVIWYTKNYAIYKNYSYRLKITSYAYSNNELLESATEYFSYGYYN